MVFFFLPKESQNLEVLLSDSYIYTTLPSLPTVTSCLTQIPPNLLLLIFCE